MPFQHDYEGPDDMPGHVKQALLGPSVTLPLAPGGTPLGPAPRLWEHRALDLTGGSAGSSRWAAATLQPPPAVGAGGRVCAVAQVDPAAEGVCDVLRALRGAAPGPAPWLGGAAGGVGTLHAFARARSGAAAAAVVVAPAGALPQLRRDLDRLATAGGTGDAALQLWMALAGAGTTVPVVDGALRLAEGEGMFVVVPGWCKGPVEVELIATGHVSPE